MSARTMEAYAQHPQCGVLFYGLAGSVIAALLCVKTHRHKQLGCSFDTFKCDWLVDTTYLPFCPAVNEPIVKRVYKNSLTVYQLAKDALSQTAHENRCSPVRP